MAGFNPSQPRDEQGRWTDTGAAKRPSVGKASSLPASVSGTEIAKQVALLAGISLLPLGGAFAVGRLAAQYRGAKALIPFLKARGKVGVRPSTAFKIVHGIETSLKLKKWKNPAYKGASEAASKAAQNTSRYSDRPVPKELK